MEAAAIVLLLVSMTCAIINASNSFPKLKRDWVRKCMLISACGSGILLAILIILWVYDQICK